jgi:hypothetical protein
MVTLIGPGGVDKTRVALAVALELVDTFVGDVWFVDLGPVRDHRRVAATIARTLDVRQSGGRSAHELLIESLRERQLLLVVDNPEGRFRVSDFVRSASAASASVCQLRAWSGWPAAGVECRSETSSRGARAGHTARSRGRDAALRPHFASTRVLA